MERPAYVSTKNESVRMFESNFMEFFSHVHPATPVVLYTPVIGYMLYASFAYKKLSVLAVAGLFVVGMFIWTLLEYVIHRYVFHCDDGLARDFQKQLVDVQPHAGAASGGGDDGAGHAAKVWSPKSRNQ